MHSDTPTMLTATPRSAAEIASIRPIVAPNVIEHEIDEDLVLYDPRSDSVHVLNETAAAVWWLCDGKLTCQEIAGQIAQLYGKQLPDVETDVLETLQLLLSIRAASGA